MNTNLRNRLIEKYLERGYYSPIKSEEVKNKRFDEAVQDYKAGKATVVQKGMVRWKDGSKGAVHGRKKNMALKYRNQLIENIFYSKENNGAL